MIGKAMIEIPPKFKDMPPIHPGHQGAVILPKRRRAGRGREILMANGCYEKAWERIGASLPAGRPCQRKYGGGKCDGDRMESGAGGRLASPDPAMRGKTCPAGQFILYSSEEAWKCSRFLLRS